jgi:hypothetical protein
MISLVQRIGKISVLSIFTVRPKHSPKTFNKLLCDLVMSDSGSRTMRIIGIEGESHFGRFREDRVDELSLRRQLNYFMQGVHGENEQHR